MFTHKYLFLFLFLLFILIHVFLSIDDKSLGLPTDETKMTLVISVISLLLFILSILFS